MKARSGLGVFNTTPPKMESKTDTTTRVAREIVDSEAAARNANMARLRAARQEMIASAAPAEPVPPKKSRTSPRKRIAASKSP